MRRSDKLFRAIVMGAAITMPACDSGKPPAPAPAVPVPSDASLGLLDSTVDAAPDVDAARLADAGVDDATTHRMSADAGLPKQPVDQVFIL